MAKLRLAMAVKRRERTSIPSILIQGLPMGPKYNVQTCCRKFSSLQKYLGTWKVGQNCEKSDPDGQIAACNGCEKEGKDIHSFNTHPKPPYGSEIQCTNMLQKIQQHLKVLGDVEGGPKL